MQLFNDGWEFCKQKLHTTLDQVMQRQDEFYPIGIPHDWLIYQSRNLYEAGCGWYRKKFHHQKKSSSELVILRFDGISIQRLKLTLQNFSWREKMRFMFL